LSSDNTYSRWQSEIGMMTARERLNLSAALLSQAANLEIERDEVFSRLAELSLVLDADERIALRTLVIAILDRRPDRAGWQPYAAGDVQWH
jgi:hypothetical protein